MSRQHSRALLVVLTIGFLVGHLILFHLWRSSSASRLTFVVVAVGFVIAGKHLGLAAGLARFLQSHFRRRQN